MDHLDEPHKSNDPEKNRQIIRNDDQDASHQSGYYYDDATNYEIYRDDADESDEDDTDS